MKRFFQTIFIATYLLSTIFYISCKKKEQTNTIKKQSKFKTSIVLKLPLEDAFITGMRNIDETKTIMPQILFKKDRKIIPPYQASIPDEISKALSKEGSIKVKKGTTVEEFVAMINKKLAINGELDKNNNFIINLD